MLTLRTLVGRKVAPVGDIGDYLNGFAFKPGDWGINGCPIIRIQNLNDRNKSFNYFNGEIHEKYKIRNGDILVSWSASLGTFRWERGDAWLNQHIFKATPNLSKVSDEFFYWVMFHAIERIARNARGSTMKHVTGKEFKNSEVVLPPLPEQKKIAHILSTVQRAIEAQERIIQTTTELFKSMLHQLMTAQISVSNGDRIDGGSGKGRGMIEGVPDGWAEVEFENFTTLQRGKDLTRAQFRKGTVPVAGSNGIIGYHDTAVAKAPGITVGRSGSAGKVTVYNEDFWPHNTSLYVREFHGNDPHFAGYLLESLNLSRFKTGASVPTLDRNSFKTLLIHVPPLPEQKKIAHILSTIQQKIDNAQSKKSKLQALFRTLLHELMTAKTRVHKLEIFA